MPDKQPGRSKYLLVSILVSALVATVFGFASGYIAGNSRFAGLLAASVLPPSWQNLLSSGPGLVAGPQGYTLPQLHQALKPPPTEDQLTIDAVKKARPAVVSITISKNVPVYESVPSSGGNDFFQQFFQNMPGFQFQQPQYQQKGTQKQDVGAGTGFLVSADGYIVTNRHVVSDETADYKVTLQDKRDFDAKVIGRDSVNDIAMLKIEGGDFPFITFGDSDKIQVGQRVIAIGYALGQFGNTVSTGIVSGLQRSLTAGDGQGMSENLFDVIQTDAAINPGNSGGPLLNLQGEAIGINVAIVQGSQNIGFSLPINDVKKVVDSLKTTGKIVRPFLGVRYVPITKELKDANQLSVDYGVLVVRGSSPTELAVMPGSPADVAGIVENDIILEINGQKITEDQPLQMLVAKLNVGDVIHLKILHKGQEKTLDVKLAERKQ